MILHMKRFSYAKFEVEGQLFVDGLVLATIEQPWTPNPNGAKGGKPFESCIPDGMYRLTSFVRPSKTGEDANTFIIWNEDLGVYRLPGDHKKGYGRDLCLIHSANFADQIQGCVAPGLARQPMRRRDGAQVVQAVTASRNAMSLLRNKLLEGQHILSITSVAGASDV